MILIITELNLQNIIMVIYVENIAPSSVPLLHYYYLLLLGQLLNAYKKHIRIGILIFSIISRIQLHTLLAYVSW